MVTSDDDADAARNVTTQQKVFDHTENPSDAGRKNSRSETEAEGQLSLAEGSVEG